MAGWDIAGEWSGEYAYDPDPAVPTLPPATPFTLVASRGWFGRFRGTAEDGPGGPPDGSATVDGRVAGKRVTFRKLYPVHYVTDSDGRWAHAAGVPGGRVRAAAGRGRAARAGLVRR